MTKPQLKEIKKFLEPYCDTYGMSYWQILNTYLEIKKIIQDNWEVK